VRGKNPYKKPDQYTLAAKKKGYPARSVFKLEEIDRRARIFKHGHKVLDLGAAPGSWSMFASQKIGGGGKVLAVDLTLIELNLGANVEFIQGDALSLDNEALGRFAPYDVVLSDMAPSTTGNRLGDQTRSFELFQHAVAVAAALGAPGSSFVGKIFMGEDFQKAKLGIKAAYAEVRTIRPEGTRTNSYELFIIGLGKKA
jgi:23S rRNA (uridine2552-2'-O)-methyltransferase